MMMGAVNAARNDRTRLSRMKGYGSHRMNHATPFAMIHRQSAADWMMTKVQDPTLLATASDSRSPNGARSTLGGWRPGLRSLSVARSLCSSAERRDVKSLIFIKTLPYFAWRPQDQHYPEMLSRAAIFTLAV